MRMQLPPAQMANQDGDAGMETMLWDFNIIPNELDYEYLMLPPGVLHMSALGRFGRFTLFRTLWLKLPFRFKILHPAHKRVSRVVGLGRSGSFRVALGS